MHSLPSSHSVASLLCSLVFLILLTNSFLHFINTFHSPFHTTIFQPWLTISGMEEWEILISCMWFSLLSASPSQWPHGLRRGSDHSSRGVIPSLWVCLSVIVKPQQWRDPSTLRAVAPWKIIVTFTIIIINHSIFYLKETINRNYLHIIQEVYVNYNFHCKNCTSCRKETKHYDCVWLARSVALSATPTNYHRDNPYSLRLSSADLFPFFSPAYKAAKLSPDLHLPTKHTNLQNQYFYCRFL